MKKFKLFITLSMLIVSYLGFAQDVTITGNVSDDEVVLNRFFEMKKKQLYFHLGKF